MCLETVNTMLAATPATMPPQQVVGLRKNQIRSLHLVMKPFLERLARFGRTMTLYFFQQGLEVRLTISA